MLTQAKEGDYTLTLSYDAAGRLAKDDQNGIAVSYSYDKDSRVISLSFLDRTVTYSYDKAGSPIRIDDIAFEYDPNHILTSVIYPNGTKERFAYDEIYNITSVATATATITYSHDRRGLITQKNGTSYGYDPTGQLTRAASESFRYDPNGNILNNNALYDTKTNRLIKNDLSQLGYDPLGNIITKQNRLTNTAATYTFDPKSRLVAYEQKDETNTTVKSLAFRYDPLGRRVGKTEDGVTKRYLYDGPNIIAILDQNNNIIATITHYPTIDTPLSITNQNGTFYYHRDHQGSIIALTDQNGNIVESFTYDEHFGTIVEHTKLFETDNPYAYTGREVDAPELYYYRARYYDPTIKRFISEDPIGFASGDYNFYRYVRNSPVNYVDPWGYWTAGISLNLSGSAFGYGGTLGLNFVMDNHGNFSQQLIIGGGGNTNISAGLSLDVEFANAECVSDLTGAGYQTGIDFSLPKFLRPRIPIFAEFGVFGGHVNGKGNYTGLYGGLGIGISVMKGSHSLYKTHTISFY
jgi:RHS repeat-associated protein